MHEYKLFVNRIGLIGITNILVALSTLIFLPILTKSLSISDYGVWVQINTTIALFLYVTTLGLPFTMVRFLSPKKDKEAISNGFYTILTIVIAFSFLISLLLLLFSKTIALTLFNGNVTITIILSLIVFLTSLNSILINYFRTFQKMKLYSIFLLLQTYLTVSIVSYFLIIGLGIDMAVLGLLITNIIIFLIMITVIIQNIGIKIPKLKNVREYLSFGLPTVPSNLSYWVVDSSDRYVIGIILGVSFVGYYSPGYTLGNFILLILAPFMVLLPAVLPKYYEEENEEKIAIFLKYSLKYFLLLAIPSVIGLSLLSKSILMILTTPDIALNGYLITPFVALSALLFGFEGIVNLILVLEKKTKLIATIGIITAIINLMLNLLLVPIFGLIGAAIVTLFSFIISFILTLHYSLQYFKFDFDIKFISKSIFASILMSIIIVLINPEGIINILITALLASLVYFTLITAFRGIKNEEINFFKKFLE